MSPYLIPPILLVFFLLVWWRCESWMHDPKSSFNTGSKVPVRRELLDPNYPDWLIKGRKFDATEPDIFDKLGAWFK
jgi:hypothetical protein